MFDFFFLRNFWIFFKANLELFLDFLCVIESGEMVNVSLFAREAANFNALEHSLCFAQIGKESLFFAKKFWMSKTVCIRIFFPDSSGRVLFSFLLFPFPSSPLAGVPTFQCTLAHACRHSARTGICSPEQIRAQLSRREGPAFETAGCLFSS